jgi:hypothetical protein
MLLCLLLLLSRHFRLQAAGIWSSRSRSGGSVYRVPACTLDGQGLVVRSQCCRHLSFEPLKHIQAGHPEQVQLQLGKGVVPHGGSLPDAVDY